MPHALEAGRICSTTARGARKQKRRAAATVSGWQLAAHALENTGKSALIDIGGPGTYAQGTMNPTVYK